MSNVKMIATVVYEDKRTLKRTEIIFGVVDIKHAEKNAKKLRPRYSKIVNISVALSVNVGGDYD